LIHEWNGFSFGKGFASGDEFGEVSSIAKLCDDVGIVFGVVDVVDFYDVFAVL
jgi:hypothetical protein